MKMQCRQIHITDLCKVERAVAGKVYPAGSCYIKLSAVDEFVGQLAEAGEIDSRFAVFEPKEKINAKYLHIAIERKFPEFLRRYRTTINLQFHTLKHFVLDWHEDKAAQDCVVKSMGMVDKEIRQIEKQIALEKEIKHWYLQKMMPG